MDIQLYQRVKVIYENESIKQIGNVVSLIKAKKPFIVCGKGVTNAGILKKVTDILDKNNIDYYIFDGVLSDPPIDIVETAAQLCKDNNCDCTIAVGGGSSMDTGKAVNMLRFNEGPLMRFTDFSTPMNPSPGLILIPTTSGTGSELSDGMVITSEDGTKCPILAPNAMADYAIIDPTLMTSMPTNLTIATGLDTFAHVVESYTSKVTNDMIGFFTEKAIDEVIRWLPVAVQDGSNLEARGHMAISCCVGGWMLGYGHTHAGHSFGHTIGAMFHVPHGVACAFALPYVLEFNAVAMPKQVKYIGEKLGAKFNGKETPDKIGEITRDAALNFIYDIVGLQSPKLFNYDESRLEELAEAVAKEMFQMFQPRKMTKEDALKILKSIYE